MSFSVPLTSFFNDVKICVTSYFMYHEGKYCTFNKILVRKRMKLRYEGKTEKSQTPAGKISIGLQLGRASLETRNLSLGCLRFFFYALLPVLYPFCSFSFSHCIVSPSLFLLAIVLSVFDLWLLITPMLSSNLFLYYYVVVVIVW